MKALSAKFNSNSSSRSRADTCGQTVGQTVVTKVIGTFRNYQTSLKAVSGEQTVVFCFLRLSKKKTVVNSLNSVENLVFVPEMQYVL